MNDEPVGREALLRGEYHGQTARIPWHDLQTNYARGNVVIVSATLDLVEVAVQLGMDNSQAFQGWIEGGDIASVSEEQALHWYDSHAVLWAVVAAPWVLIQHREPNSDVTE